MLKLKRKIHVKYSQITGGFIDMEGYKQEFIRFMVDSDVL